MKSVARENHRDSDYLISNEHDGADAATTLRDMSLDLLMFGVAAGLYIENTTQSTNSLIATVTAHEITTDDNIIWNKDDTYEIYKTAAKNSFISAVWTDVSRGWKVTSPDELNRDGWLLEDEDLDDHGRKKVFGPNQPEPIRKS